ncbi:MAG: HAMP domain-containing sensor histidine kinase [Thermodesulfobacteriota bacterium]
MNTNPPTQPSSPRRGLGLNARVSLGIVLLSSLALLGFGALDYLRARQEMREDLLALAQRSARRLAISLRTPAWDMHAQLILEIMHSEMQNRDLACVVFREAPGKGPVLALGRDGDWQPRQTPNCRLEQGVWDEVELEVRGTRLGSIRVGVTPQFQQERLLERFWDSLARMALLEILIVLGLYIYLRRAFIAPLLALARTARRIARDKDYSVRAGGHRNDEMGQLVSSFNAMIGEVRSREQRLQSHSQSLEQEVARRTRDLSRQAEELQAANERLRELDEMKSAIITSVSHELRTPLTSVLGFAKMARKNFLKLVQSAPPLDADHERRAETISQNLGIIEEEGQRLTRLINDFLELSRIESGRMEWREIDTDPGQAIRHALQAASGQLAARPEITLAADIPADLPRMLLDPDRFEQLLLNLVNNAMKFTPAGAVRVSARAGDGVLRLCVEDTGIGIRRNDLGKVFDTFFQAHKVSETGEKSPGTGLGLAICRQIVEHYGGDIWVESEPGRGSRFILELPLAPETAQEGAP